MVSTGEIEVKPSETKPPQEEPIEAPPPKGINYNAGKPQCASCGMYGSREKPLLVFKRITALPAQYATESASAKIEEITVHRNCIGVVMVVWPHSLFQVKYTMSHKETL